jgi:hypothetical protein
MGKRFSDAFWLIVLPIIAAAVHLLLFSGLVWLFPEKGEPVGPFGHLLIAMVYTWPLVSVITFLITLAVLHRRKKWARPIRPFYGRVMTRAVLPIIAASCLCSAGLSLYALVLRDNRRVKYLVINPATGERFPAPENVKTERVVRMGRIAGITALLLAVAVLVDFAVRLCIRVIADKFNDRDPQPAD